MAAGGTSVGYVPPPGELLDFSKKEGPEYTLDRIVFYLCNRDKVTFFTIILHRVYFINVFRTFILTILLFMCAARQPRDPRERRHHGAEGVDGRHRLRRQRPRRAEGASLCFVTTL